MEKISIFNLFAKEILQRLNFCNFLESYTMNKIIFKKKEKGTQEYQSKNFKMRPTNDSFVIHFYKVLSVQIITENFALLQLCSPLCIVTRVSLLRYLYFQRLSLKTHQIALQKAVISHRVGNTTNHLIRNSFSPRFSSFSSQTFPHQPATFSRKSQG